jgi:hypothetical protein
LLLWMDLHYPEIAELPGVRRIDVLWIQAAAAGERRPVRVCTNQLSKIGR